MKSFDKFLSVMVIGTVAPVIGLLLFWWGSIPFIKDNDHLIMLLALMGLVIGLLLDLTFLRKVLLQLFVLPLPVLAAVEIFYSLMIYGFFMGFPVFNSFVGIVGVYIVAKRGIVQNISKKESIKSRNFINRISIGILSFLCVCTAVLALRESTICSQVKGMLNLPFDVTMGMIWVLIVIGGGSLLLFQYAVSRLVFAKVMK